MLSRMSIRVLVLAIVSVSLASMSVGCGAARSAVVDPRVDLVVNLLLTTPEAYLVRFANVAEAVPDEWRDESGAPGLFFLEPGDLESVEAGDFFLPQEAELPDLFLLATQDGQLYALLSQPEILPRAWPVVRLSDKREAEVVAANIRDFLAANLDDADFSDREPEEAALWQLRIIELWRRLGLGLRNVELRQERTEVARDEFADFWNWPTLPTPTPPTPTPPTPPTVAPPEEALEVGAESGQ
ncbi:MAG: hypothetical protein ACI9WU_000873 [Myxococcota bacterium]|jgi:hypothetical protein